MRKLIRTLSIICIVFLLILTSCGGKVKINGYVSEEKTLNELYKEKDSYCFFTLIRSEEAETSGFFLEYDWGDGKSEIGKVILSYGENTSHQIMYNDKILYLDDLEEGDVVICYNSKGSIAESNPPVIRAEGLYYTGSRIKNFKAPLV